MQEKKWSIGRAADLFFYAGLLLEILIVLIDKSAYTNPIEGQLFRLTFLLFVAKISLTRYTGRQWLVMIGFGLLAAVSYFCNGKDEAVRLVVFVAAMKDVAVPKALKLTHMLTMAGCLALVTLSVTGVFGTLKLVQDFGRGGVETRYCLGLGHPNALHCMFFMLLALGIYLYFDKLAWWQYITLFAANLGLFMLTDSKTGFLSSLGTLVLAMALKASKKLQNSTWIYWAAALIIVFCTGISLVFSIAGERYYQTAYLAPFWEKLDNSLMTGRIKTACLFAHISHIRLFSAKELTQPMDLGFVKMLYWYGYVPTFAYTAVTAWLAFRMRKEKDFKGLLLLTVLTLYTVVESHTVSVFLARNYSLFLLGAYWPRLFGGTGGRESYWWTGFGLWKASGRKLRVVMIGADRTVHGGVSAVVNQYYEAGLPEKVDLTYIGTMVDGSGARKLFQAVTAYLRFLRHLPKMDILHANMAADASFYRKRIFIVTAKAFHKKVVIHEHGGDFVDFYEKRCDRAAKEKVRKTLQMADAFLVLSVQWADFFRPLLGGREPVILENGILLPEEKKEDYSGSGLLFLGRLEAAKGLEELLDAMELLAVRFPEVTLTLGGVWLDEALQKRAQANGRVRFLGWIAPTEKNRQFRENSIFVLPSHFEGQPVALLEAMAAGMAVVATAVGGIPQMVQSGENGLLVPPGSAKELAEAIAQLLAEEKLRCRLGRAARKTIQERYDLHDRLEKLVRLYEAL